MLNFVPFLALGALQSSSIQVNPLLLVEAREVWSIIGRPNNPIWPGWDARKTPILIYFPGKQDLLVNHPHPPKGFVRYAGPVRSSIGSIYLRDGKTFLDLDGQNTSMPVGGVQTLVIADTLSTRRQWVEGLVPALSAEPNRMDEIVAENMHPDPYSQMVMFAHEAFHVYQHQMAPGKGGDEMALALYPSLSVENNVGTALEAEYLAAAIGAKTTEEVRQNAVKWLAVRDWRRGIIGKAASDYEDGTEFSEGTAQYVEYRAMQILQTQRPSREMWLLQGFHGYEDLDRERRGLLKQMQGFMSGSLSVNNDLYGASPVRFRLYFSGMGIGVMMDRLGAEWHDRALRTPASLTELCREAIHATPAELSSALAAVRVSPEFVKLTASKAKLAEEGRGYVAGVVGGFDTAAGTVTIDYSQLPEAKLELSYTAFGILRVDDDRTIFRLVPVGGRVGGVEFSEDGPRPMLKDARAKSLEYTLTGALDDKRLCEALKVSSLDGAAFEAAELKLPGVTLKNVKGRATLRGKRLVLVLRP